MPSLKFDATIESSKVVSGFEDIQKAVHRTSQQIQTEGESIDAVINKIQNTFNLAIGGWSAGKFISQMMQVRGQFQQTEMAFKTMLQSETKANDLMQQMIHTAAITPFGVEDVTEGAKQLLAFNVSANEVNDTLIRLGDVAAGMGINLSDMVMLYGTTIAKGKMDTMDLYQFLNRGIPIADELAKVMGLDLNNAIAEVKEQLTAGKVTSDVFIQAMQNMTSEGSKFGGLMEAQSKTITGQISNIEDAVEQMFNNLGKSQEGIINTGLDVVTALVENWEKVGEAVLAAASSIGMYKAMTIGIAAFDRATTNVGYAAELSALDALIPMKEEAKQSDIEEAVAKGQLSAAQAELVASKREEVQAYIEELNAKAAAATTENNEALKEVEYWKEVLKARTQIYDLAAEEHLEATIGLNDAEKANDAAKEKVDAAQAYYDLQKEIQDANGGNEDELAAASKELNAAATEKLATEQALETAVSQENTTAKAMNTAEENMNTASGELNAAVSRQKATAKTAETATTEANTVAQGLNTAATERDTAAKGIHAQFTLLCQKAQDAWNASMFASPLFWIAAVIAGVAYAIYSVATAATAAEIAQDGWNKTIDEYNKKQEDRKRKIQELVRTIQDANTTDLQKQLAFDELGQIAPELTQIYDSVKKLESVDLSNFERQLNSLSDDTREQDLKNQINQLKEYIKAIQNTSASAADMNKQREAIQGLKDNFGIDKSFFQSGKVLTDAAQEYINKLQEELSKIEEAKDEISEPTEIDVKLAEKEYEESKEELEYLSNFVLAMKSDIEGNPINVPFDGNEAERIISELEGKADKLRKEQEANPITFTADKQKALNTYQSLLTTMKNWKATAKKNGLFNIPITISLLIKKLEQEVKGKKEKADKKKTKANTKPTGDNADAATAYANAKKEYEDAKKNYEKIQNAVKKNVKGYTVKQLNDAKSTLEAKRKAWEALGGDPRGSKDKNKKDDSDAKKKAEERKKAEEKLNNDLKKLQQQNEDNSIAILQEGTEKKIKQIQNDYKKRNEEIDKQEAEFKKNNKVSGKSEKLTNEQSNALQQARDNAKKQMKAQTEEVYRSEAESMQEYLKNYGSFNAQKLAIAQEYADKIRAVNESTDTVSTKQWKIKALQKEQKKETDNVEATAIQAKIDWYQVFGNVGNIMSGVLRPVLEELKQYTQTDKFRNLGVDQQKAIVKAMDNIRNQIGDTGDLNWHDLATAITDYQTALQVARQAQDEDANLQAEYANKIKEAKEDLERAQKSGDEIEITNAQNALDEFTYALVTSSEKVQKANDNVTISGQKLAQTTQSVTQPIDEIHNFLSTSGLSDLQTLWDSFNQIKGAVDGLKAISKVNEGAEGLNDAIQESTEAAGEAGKVITDSLAEGLSKAGFIAQIIAAVLKILDALKDGIGPIVSGLIDSILGAISGIIDNILSGEFVKQIGGALVNGIGNILNSIIGNLGHWLSFGALSSDMSDWFLGSNAKEVAETTEKLTAENERLRSSVNSLKNEITKSGGQKSLQAYKEALSNQQRIQSNAYIMWTKQMGYHGAHHSNAKWWKDNVKQQTYDYINNMLSGYATNNPNAKRTRDSVSSLSDIYELTPEQLAYIRTYNPELWYDITHYGDYDKSAYWDQVADMAGQVEELTDAMREGFTSISFDSLKDSFADALMDMDKTSEDFANDFSKYLMRSVINAKIADLLEDDLKKFYNEWAELSKDGLSEDDVDYLKNKWENYVNKGIKIRDEASQITGYTGENSSQTATAGGFENMSQDSADELNGRFTALQIAGESIANNIINAVAQMESIVSLGVSTNGAVIEIRNMMIMTNSYLEDIVKYVKLTYTEFGAKMSTIQTELRKI